MHCILLLFIVCTNRHDHNALLSKELTYLIVENTLLKNTPFERKEQTFFNYTFQTYTSDLKCARDAGLWGEQLSNVAPMRKIAINCQMMQQCAKLQQLQKLPKSCKKQIGKMLQQCAKPAANFKCGLKFRSRLQCAAHHLLFQQLRIISSQKEQICHCFGFLGLLVLFCQKFDNENMTG